MKSCLIMGVFNKKLKPKDSQNIPAKYAPFIISARKALNYKLIKKEMYLLRALIGHYRGN